MPKNLLFLVYLILLQLVTEIKSQDASFTPLKRGGHTATLIDDKLYILGGYSIGNVHNVDVMQL